MSCTIPHWYKEEVFRLTYSEVSCLFLRSGSTGGNIFDTEVWTTARLNQNRLGWADTSLRLEKYVWPRYSEVAQWKDLGHSDGLVIARALCYKLVLPHHLPVSSCKRGEEMFFLFSHCFFGFLFYFGFLICGPTKSMRGHMAQWKELGVFFRWVRNSILSTRSSLDSLLIVLSNASSLSTTWSVLEIQNLKT